MRKGGLAVTALGALAAVFLSACASTSPSAGTAYGAAAGASASTKAGTTTSQPRGTLLSIKKARIGYVLTNAQGYTLYWYAKDVRDSGKSTCTGQCLSAWPAVTGKPDAGSGIKLNGALGSITRPGGIVQATYNGYPLYTYASDTGPGDTAGNGVGGVWHVITGKVLTSSVPKSSTSPSSGSSTSSGSGYGSGGGYGGY